MPATRKELVEWVEKRLAFTMDSRKRAGVPASRKELAEWVEKITGKMVNTTPTDMNQHFRNGVLFCELLEHVRPGEVELRKLHKEACAEADMLSNLKVLDSAFKKLEMAKEMDMHKVARAQPQAILDMLQRIYSLRADAPSDETRTALGDTNGRDAGGQQRKRHAEDVAQGQTPSKRASVGGGNAPRASASDGNTPLVTLQCHLEQARAETRGARAELEELRLERDFYYAKLAIIEDACFRAEIGERPDEATEESAESFAKRLRIVLAAPDVEVDVSEE